MAQELIIKMLETEEAMSHIFNQNIDIEYYHYDERLRFDAYDIDNNQTAYVVFQGSDDRDEALFEDIRDYITMFDPEFIQRVLRIDIPFNTIARIKKAQCGRRFLEEFMCDNGELKDIIDNEFHYMYGKYFAQYDEEEHIRKYNGVLYYIYRTD